MSCTQTDADDLPSQQQKSTDGICREEKQTSKRTEIESSLWRDKQQNRIGKCWLKFQRATLQLTEKCEA